MPQEGQYNKDFDGWNQFKKNLEKNQRLVYAHPREVWWCSLGVNLGVEIDGKNNNYERPGVVVKVHNKHSLVILPTTTEFKDDPFHFEIKVLARGKQVGFLGQRSVWVKLTQARTISNKRLLRKVDVLEEAVFENLREEYKKYI